MDARKVNGLRRFEPRTRLLPCNGVRRAAHIDSRDCVEKKEALARAVPKYDEALSSFVFGLQNPVLVCIRKEGNVIRSRYLISLSAGGHESERDKRCFRRYLAKIFLFRMHAHKQYRKD